MQDGQVTAESKCGQGAVTLQDGCGLLPASLCLQQGLACSGDVTGAMCCGCSQPPVGRWGQAEWQPAAELYCWHVSNPTHHASEAGLELASLLGTLGLCNVICPVAVRLHDILLLPKGSAALQGKHASRSRPCVCTWLSLTVAILVVCPVWVMTACIYVWEPRQRASVSSRDKKLCHG